MSHSFLYVLLLDGPKCSVKAIHNIHLVVTEHAVQTATPVAAARLPVQSENEVVRGRKELQLKLSVRTAKPTADTTSVCTKRTLTHVTTAYTHIGNRRLTGLNGYLIIRDCTLTCFLSLCTLDLKLSNYLNNFMVFLNMLNMQFIASFA